MLKRCHLLYFALLALLVSVQSIAQTPQQILHNYVQAIGGKERIDSVKTAIVKVNMSGPASTGSGITYLQRDYKYRVELAKGDGTTSVHCYDGSEHTGINKLVISMIKEINKKPHKFSVFNDVIFVPPSDLKSEPDEILNGKKYQVLSHDDTEWHVYNKYYFDPETHLLVATDSKILTKELGSPTFYENYQAIDGILFPMRSSMEVMGFEFITQYTEIILNPELPDTIFVYNPE